MGLLVNMCEQSRWENIRQRNFIKLLGQYYIRQRNYKVGWEEGCECDCGRGRGKTTVVVRFMNLINYELWCLSNMIQ